MTYDVVKRIIKMVPTAAGNYELKVRITDDDGEYSTETIRFRFEYSLVINEEIKIIETEIEKFEENPKNSQKNELNKDF